MYSNKTPYQEGYENREAIKDLFLKVSKQSFDNIGYYWTLPNITYTASKAYRSKYTYPDETSQDVIDYKNPTMWEFNPPNYTVYYYFDKQDKQGVLNTHYYELLQEYLKPFENLLTLQN